MVHAASDIRQSCKKSTGFPLKWPLYSILRQSLLTHCLTGYQQHKQQTSEGSSFLDLSTFRLEMFIILIKDAQEVGWLLGKPILLCQVSQWPSSVPVLQSGFSSQPSDPERLKTDAVPRCKQVYNKYKCPSNEHFFHHFLPSDTFVYLKTMQGIFRNSENTSRVNTIIYKLLKSWVRLIILIKLMNHDLQSQQVKLQVIKITANSELAWKSNCACLLLAISQVWAEIWNLLYEI